MHCACTHKAADWRNASLFADFQTTLADDSMIPRRQNFFTLCGNDPGHLCDIPESRASTPTVCFECLPSRKLSSVSEQNIKMSEKPYNTQRLYGTHKAAGKGNA